MQPRARRTRVHRICAVCGKRHGATYGFKTTLARLGLKGDKAVPACVAAAARLIEGQRRLQREAQND